MKIPADPKDPNAEPHAPRPGEHRFAIDPGLIEPDAGIVFIGHLETPWRHRTECPKNLRQARETGKTATVVVKPDYRIGLTGLETGQTVYLLYWMHEARRDLGVQAPRHRDAPTGVFNLRSPVRPNPIALAAVVIVGLDRASGHIEIDAIDCLDGTPLLDIKPFYPTVDTASSNPA